MTFGSLVDWWTGRPHHFGGNLHWREVVTTELKPQHRTTTATQNPPSTPGPMAARFSQMVGTRSNSNHPPPERAAFAARTSPPSLLIVSAALGKSLCRSWLDLLRLWAHTDTGLGHHRKSHTTSSQFGFEADLRCNSTNSRIVSEDSDSKVRPIHRAPSVVLPEQDSLLLWICFFKKSRCPLCNSWSIHASLLTHVLFFRFRTVESSNFKYLRCAHTWECTSIPAAQTNNFQNPNQQLSNWCGSSKWNLTYFQHVQSLEE